MFRKAVSDLDNWGLLAVLDQYHKADNHIMSIQAKVDMLEHDLKGFM
jgi:hypothetical protein